MASATNRFVPVSGAAAITSAVATAAVAIRVLMFTRRLLASPHLDTVLVNVNDESALRVAPTQYRSATAAVGSARHGFWRADPLPAARPLGDSRAR
jgi:hypothetical protein